MVVISEFGRTFRENGDKGTDHGHGSAYWVLGGGVNGGRIAGEQVKVERGQPVPEPRFSGARPITAVCSAVSFRKIYGFDATTLDKIFPAAKPLDLALV